MIEIIYIKTHGKPLISRYCDFTTDKYDEYIFNLISIGLFEVYQWDLVVGLTKVWGILQVNI